MLHPKQKNNKLWLWIIFIIYPLGAFVYSIKHFAIKEYRVFILLFFMFYGYTFLPIPSSDGSRYQEDFALERAYTFDKYTDDIGSVLKGESDTTDFYAPTLKFVVHSFTNNPKFYFMIAALVYFFIYLKLLDTIWKLVAEDGKRFFISFFIGCCFIYNLSAGVNAIRFPLAFMVFAYGALNLVLTQKRKYLLIAFVSGLIHFAMFYSVVFLLIIYLFKFKINRWILYILLILVTLIGYLFPSFIIENMVFFGKVSETKIEGYTQDGFVETRVDHLQVWNWYVYFNFYSTYLFCLFSLLLTRIRIFKIKYDSISEKLFVFAAFMLIHSLLSGNVVDVISNRYNLVFVFFNLVYLLYLSLNNRESKLLTILNYIYIPILILNVLVRMRGDLYTVNTMVVFGNVIAAFFMDVTVSIQDFLTS
jgi:EpsG family